MQRVRTVLLATALVVAGCGSYVVVKLPPSTRASETSYEVAEAHAVAEGVPPSFLHGLTAAVQAKLSSAGRLAQPGEAGVYRVTLMVTEFYERNATARIIVGPLAGSDDAEVTVQALRPSDGQVRGEWQAYAYDATNWGDSDDVIDALADKIVSGLLQRGG